MTAGSYVESSLWEQRPALNTAVPPIEGVYGNTDEERRRARLVVAAHALGAADCAELLAALALDGER